MLGPICQFQHPSGPSSHFLSCCNSPLFLIAASTFAIQVVAFIRDLLTRALSILRIYFAFLLARMQCLPFQIGTRNFESQYPLCLLP